jgi:3-oxoadipate enol-lactonase
MECIFLLFGYEYQYRRWPLAQEHLVHIISGFRKHEFVLQRLAINIANHTRDLGKVKCPVLGIVGDATNIGIRYMQRAINVIPQARLEIVANSFDPTNLCQREIYDQLVAKFLKHISW